MFHCLKVILDSYYFNRVSVVSRIEGVLDTLHKVLSENSLLEIMSSKIMTKTMRYKK
jgi:hypothetical protein